MDGNNQTSFIPKRPLVTTDSAVSYEKKGVSIVTVITIILFLGAIALSVGSYFYQKFLGDMLNKKQETLQQARKGFDIDTIKELKRLDTRIETSRNLLDKHVAISGIFDILQQSTLKTISYGSFDITTVATGDSGDTSADGTGVGAIHIRMLGLAQSYNSVALQSDLLSKTRGIKEPIFSNIGLDAAGDVTFAVSALVDPSVLRYRSVNGYEGSAAPAVNTSSPVPVAPSAASQ